HWQGDGFIKLVDGRIVVFTCARFCLFGVSTRQRQNDMNGARVTSSLQNTTLAEHEIFRTHVSARPLHDQIHRELMSAHDEPLSVLLGLLAVVENGYDR